MFEVAKIVDNKYRIVRRIGYGGMGSVFEAVQLEFDRRVAIKFLGLTDSPSFLRRFEREAQALNAMNHRNVVRFYGYGVVDNTPYLVMEYLEGQNLQALLGENGKLPARQALEIAAQICDGLICAHANSLIHRDLKPTNVMLIGPSLQPVVKLVDFGLVKALPGASADAQKLTNAGETVGSVLYMSPEQCYNEAVDARADIYSAGCILQHCLTGAPPFSGNDTIAIMQQHVQSAPPMVAWAGGDAVDVDADLLQMVVSKALHKERKHRYQTAAEFREDLSSLLSSKSPEVPPKVRAVSRNLRATGKTAQSSPLILFLPAILLGLLALLIVAKFPLFPETVAHDPVRTPSVNDSQHVFVPGDDSESSLPCVGRARKLFDESRVKNVDEIFRLSQDALTLNKADHLLGAREQMFAHRMLLQKYMTAKYYEKMQAEFNFICDSCTQASLGPSLYAELGLLVSRSEFLPSRQQYVDRAAALVRRTKAPKKFQRAERTFKRLIATGYVMVGDPHRASSMLESDLVGAPTPEEYVTLARIYLALHRDPEALSCARVAAANPQLVDAWPQLLLMKALIANGKFHEAERKIKIVSKLSRALATSPEMLIAANRKNWTAATTLANATLRIFASRPDLFFMFGGDVELPHYIELLENDGQHQRAEAVRNDVKNIVEKCNQMHR